MSSESQSVEIDASRITPEGRVRLDKYGSTVDAANVASICQRIADYPEILAAAAGVMATDMAQMLDRFPQHGRHTRARWAVQWLGLHASRDTNLTRAYPPARTEASDA